MTKFRSKKKSVFSVAPQGGFLPWSVFKLLWSQFAFYFFMVVEEKMDPKQQKKLGKSHPVNEIFLMRGGGYHV